MCLTLMREPSWIGVQPQRPHFTVVCTSGGDQNYGYKLSKLGQQGQPQHSMHSSICTSTAYKCFQTLHMCLTLMWEPPCMGLWPQTPHYTDTVVKHLEEDQNLGYLSLSLVKKSSRIIIKNHPYAHPQHMNVVKHFICV